MNEKMWASPAVAENVRVLRERGARLVGPDEGEMAERSHVGPGRMSEPAAIFTAAVAALEPRDLEGVAVLVTAGPTREMLDAVRFISNPSSGRMGYALAEAARDRGAAVTLISGPVELPPLPRRPAGARGLRRRAGAGGGPPSGRRAGAGDGSRRFRSAAEEPRRSKDQEAAGRRDADPGAHSRHPRRRGRARAPAAPGGLCRGEREREENAREKLQRKGLDLIVANDVADAFGKETNRVIVLGKDGARSELSGSKLSLAHAIWSMVRDRLSG